MKFTEQETQTIKESLEELKVYRLKDENSREAIIGGLLKNEIGILEKLTPSVPSNDLKLEQLIKKKIEEKLEFFEIQMVKMIAKAFLEYDKYELKEKILNDRHFNNVGKRNPKHYNKIEKYFEEFSGALYLLQHDKVRYETVKEGLELYFYDMCSFETDKIVNSDRLRREELMSNFNISGEKKFGDYVRKFKMNIWKTYFDQVYSNLLKYTILEYQNEGIKEFNVTNTTLKYFKKMLKEN